MFSELLQNALEHGGDDVRIELAQRDADIVLAIVDDGAGLDREASGTGLSIVRALVRDELRGDSARARRSENGTGTRAQVVFPG